MDWLKKLLGHEPAKQVEQVIEPKPEPEPKVNPYTAEYDDWEQKHDEWRQIKVCHCGYMVPIRGGISIMPSGNVCPECGHTDKWAVGVYRFEYEHSKAMEKALRAYWGRYAFGFEATRNKKLVKWTEDHCKINEDSSQ